MSHNVAPERPFAACGACNCMPGSCALRERATEIEVQAVIHDALNPKAKPVPMLKNRKQRRFEARIARRGSPAKKRW